MKYIKLFLMAIAILGFSACNSNNTQGDNSSFIQNSEISKIQRYAQEGKVNELTINDYREANFHAVTTDNIEEYNTLVSSLSNDNTLMQELDKLDARLNQKPIAHPQSLYANENIELNITLTGEDEDVENLAYEIVEQPSHGRVESTYPTISGKMAHVTYTPNRNYSGSDSFSFKVFDGREYSDVVDVNIIVTRVGHSKLTGVVKEIGTDTKLANVTVVLKNSNDITISETRSDPLGSYEFNNLVSGRGYNLEYQKEGYSTLCYKSVDLEDNETKSLEVATLSRDTNTENGVVLGRIINALNGDGVYGVTLKVRRCINNTTGEVIAEVDTTQDGYYQLSIPQGTYTIETVRDGYTSSSFTIFSIGGEEKGNQNSSISPILAEGEMRIVLNWGERPEDLDAHLVKETDGVRDYYIYWEYRGQRIQDAILDRDDRDSFGPETITIFNPSPNSTYSYYVFNFSSMDNSNVTPLKDSNAKVEIIFNDIRRTFNVPNEDGNFWKVFDIINGQVVPCSENCISSI